MNVRVAELCAVRQFRLVEAELADPGPGEVQVRIQAVGICGSDLHSYSEGGVGDTPCQYPMVLGHEPAGVVARVGAGVTGWVIRDRAAFEPAIYCYHCEFCHTGHHNVCANLRFMSMPGDPGFFRDYANIPAGNLIAIPPGLSLRDATIIEPLAVVLHSMQFVALQPSETAAVFGAGPIGLMTVICLKLAGAGRVWAVDPVAARRELARQAGADAVLDPSAIDPSHQILRDTGGRGVDVAIDCATTGGSTNHCLRAARHAGRVVVTGIPVEREVPLEFSPMRRKELAIFTVRRSNHETEAAREMLAANLARFAALITHTRPLERIAEAFHQVEHRLDGVGKLVVSG
ncbi:MAG TPA: alcohol dehydrogenase catalytic domain-containing protein [Bryobacteraceae bacterium]|jgi:L-iditol 2-dehydrogenase|nr:alcohol dehydrogenase catalytic domain-containing protein [Bryobacteraceae bacterium]